MSCIQSTSVEYYVHFDLIDRGKGTQFFLTLYKVSIRFLDAVIIGNCIIGRRSGSCLDEDEDESVEHILCDCRD